MVAGQDTCRMERIWRATEADAPAVARLLGEFRDWWGYSGPSDESFRAGVERLLGDPNTAYLLAADGEGEPAAVCQLRFRHGLWRDGEDCWFEDLYVSESARRAGLGRALVEAACEHARQRGCRRIQLDVNEANPPAVGLYESLGFSSWADPPGGRNLFMGRRL
jgi:ribosomal protein S18 acetylase RimI-like enzyme